MLSKASESLTNRLISVGIVKAEDFDIYQFGIENTILKLIHMVSYIVLGLILGRLPELIIFLAAFIPLREYSGGFHAKTPLRCYIVSCITVFTVLLILRFSPTDMMNYSIPIALVGSFLLFLVIPVEAKDKPLDDSEKIYYKSKGGFLILLALILTLIFKMLELDKVGFILSLAIIYEMIIALAGKYIKGRD
jgi:accessory gene regulator B